MFFNIFLRQRLTDDFWGLHKNMNCTFTLSSVFVSCFLGFAPWLTSICKYFPYLFVFIKKFYELIFCWTWGFTFTQCRTHKSMNCAFPLSSVFFSFVLGFVPWLTSICKYFPYLFVFIKKFYELIFCWTWGFTFTQCRTHKSMNCAFPLSSVFFSCILGFVPRFNSIC